MGSPRAVCQRMPVTIRRRLRALTSSPRWRLTMLVFAMLFVGSSAMNCMSKVEDDESPMMGKNPCTFRVKGAGDPRANGTYESRMWSSLPAARGKGSWGYRQQFYLRDD